MNAIIGYTTLARREESTPEEMREFLDKIDVSSQHLLSLINDVLEMSRIESGKLELEPAETDLAEMKGEVRDMFAAQMEQKGIAYTVDASQVTDRWVLCDKNRLNLVLLNLLSNAWKFTPSGGSVSAALIQTWREGNIGSYEIRVKDTGIGMSREFAAHVFEAFERERTSTVSGIQGTGLGMAITRSIVEMSGGTIEVQTEKGKGTEFVVRLDFPVLEKTEETERNADAAETAAVDFSTKRLLLVEDNEINREIATMILEEAGFRLESAENGRLGLDKVAASEPGYFDAVLMDIQMPVMNGYEATRSIRALNREDARSMPIIALSANAREEDRRMSLESGMNHHIAKPFDVAQLISTVNEHIAARKESG